MVVEVDRKALLKGDIEIFLKETKYVLNGDGEVCTVKQIHAHKLVIIEIDGVCYVSLPFDMHTVQGMLYETRNTFDDLMAQYHTDEAGSNAPNKEE